MPTKTSWLFFIICCAGIVAYGINRDIHIEQQYTADLRNRIVGARLQEDHVSPYFYKWKPADGLRYYDPCNDNNNPTSNITGTPFLHQLMIPMADLPGRSGSRRWLLIEYILFAACVGIGLLLAGTPQQKMMVGAVGALMLLTEAWKFHVATGQYYLLIPFLALAFCFFSRKKDSLLYGALAGLSAIVLVLVRPNALVFFLPFLLLVRTYSARWLIAFSIPVLLLAGWSVADRQQRTYWLDFETYLGQEVQHHQQSAITPVGVQQPLQAQAGRHINEWEGWSVAAISDSHARYPYQEHSEHGNVFVMVYKLFHFRCSIALLNTASALVILSLTGLFAWKRNAALAPEWPGIAILGFCLYMISDLFSPVWRHQYNTIQWLCPLLLAAAAWRPNQKTVFVLLGLAIVLNIVNLSFMKMEHTIGEYMMLGLLLWLVIGRIGKPGPAGAHIRS